MSSTAKKSNAPKKKLVVSYKNLPADILELVKEKYPKGYSDYVIKVDKGVGDFFYAITLDTEDISYLIKVDVKIDKNAEDIEKEIFGSSDTGSSEEDFIDAGDDDTSFADEEE